MNDDVDRFSHSEMTTARTREDDGAAVRTVSTRVMASSAAIRVRRTKPGLVSLYIGAEEGGYDPLGGRGIELSPEQANHIGKLLFKAAAPPQGADGAKACLDEAPRRPAEE